MKKDNEYFNIKSKEFQSEKQRIKDAPKFREYILYLFKNVDKTEEELRREKVSEYQRRYQAKKKRLAKEKEQITKQK